jgi:hypothetical protein
MALISVGVRDCETAILTKGMGGSLFEVEP